ncbi:MAG: hypothetical protein QM769_09630 [Pseudoxanthomonas sp.]
MAMDPFHFGPPERRMFAVYHPARGAVRGAVLVCPPLLHEHVRSYRFFSLLCERFAEAGLACLRFDYYGTGDSGGEDADFSPDAAIGDIAAAAAELRRRTGDVPLALLAVRASALLAAEAAPVIAADVLWLWLPVADGKTYVETLDEYYAHELASPDRYPTRDGTAPRRADDLMGFRLSSAFRPQLSARRLPATADALPPTVLVCAEDDDVAIDGAVRLRLPDAATQWTGEIDLRSLILVRDVEPTVQALLVDWPQPRGQVAHG